MKILTLLLLFPIIVYADFGQPECNVTYDKDDVPVEFTDIYDFHEYDSSTFTPDGVSRFNPDFKIDYDEYLKNDYFKVITGTIIHMDYDDDNMTVQSIIIQSNMGQRYFINIPSPQDMRCIYWQNKEVNRILELWKYFDKMVKFTSKMDGASGQHLILISATIDE